MLLFSDRSISAMVHGMALGGAALMALTATWFLLWTMSADKGTHVATERQSRALSRLTSFVAGVLWLSVISGTYVVFPPYRATPPAGVADLSAYPRALILASPETAWLHAFAMETKEHVPWMAAMLATAVAFVSARGRSVVLADRRTRGFTMMLVAICLTLVGYTAVLGVLVNKVAPLE
jgi:hypothetical protein